MLAFDLDLYEKEIKEIEEEVKTIELQFGENEWEVCFKLSSSRKTVTVISCDLLKSYNTNDSLQNNVVEINDNKYITFPGCAPMRYKTFTEIILNNYMVV